MRIVEVIGAGEVTGGAERQLADLAVRLLDRGHEVAAFFTTRGGSLAERISSAGGIVRGRSNPAPYPAGRFEGLATRVQLEFEFRELARDFRPEVIHAWLPHVAGRAASWRRRYASDAALVLALRGATPALSSDHAKSLGYWLQGCRTFDDALAEADRVVVNAPHLVNDEVVARGVQRDRAVVIPNGVVLPDIVADPTVIPPSGVAVGFLRPTKYYDVLIEALAATQSEVVVRVCGTGTEQSRLLALAERCGIRERFCIVPPPADVTAELRRAQFGVHPSKSEGFPNAVLEEMAAGLPVIATRVGSIETLIEDGRNGILIYPGDEVALARAIDRLAGDPELRQSLGGAARLTAAEYSWDRCVSAYEALFSEVLAERASGRAR